MSARAKLFHPTPKNHVFHRAILSSLVLMLSCTPASGEQTPHKPLVTKLAKDPITSLYTITVKADKSPLLLDLAGSLVWLTCPPPSSSHSNVASQSGPCRGAASQQWPLPARGAGVGMRLRLQPCHP